MRPNKVCLVVALAMVLPTWNGHGQEGKKKMEPVHALMHKKLQEAQKLLEGLALNDYHKIGRAADELIDISKRAEFRAVKTAQYELHSNEFRRVADNLSKAAREKNLDSAALNYVDLTLTCIKCHKYVREVRMTKLERPEAIPTP